MEVCDQGIEKETPHFYYVKEDIFMIHNHRIFLLGQEVLLIVISII